MSEAALRKERRAFLLKVLKKENCDYVLTAHHADDQLETVWMRFIRGTGLKGLGSIWPKRGVWLKPLLPFSKSEILDFLHLNQIAYRTDESNLSHSYFRNRVRHKLIPVVRELSQEFGTSYQFDRRVRLLLTELRRTDAFLNKEVNRIYHHLAVETPFWIWIRHDPLLKLPLVLKNRLLLKILKLAGCFEIGRRDLTRARRAMTSHRGCTLKKNVRMVLSCGYVFFYRSDFDIRSRQLKSIEDMGFKPKVRPDDPCELRFFSPGDRKGSTKLKTLYLKARIPMPERRFLPVLAKKKSHEIEKWYPRNKESMGLHIPAFRFTCADL